MPHTTPMNLSEIADRLYVNKHTMASVTPLDKFVAVEVFEKNNKWYLIRGYALVLEYIKGTLTDVEVIERMVFRFHRSDFVLLNRVPHQMSDV